MSETASAGDVRTDDVALRYPGGELTLPVVAAAEGADPEQIGKAIDQSISRGLATAEQILTLARRPHYLGRRVALPLLEGALTRAAA